LGKGLIEVHEDAAGHDHRPLSTRAAVHALNLRLVRFLKDVKLVDLIMPGRRIDVPVERLSRRSSTSTSAVAITN
jgi:hypothetical protein